MSANLINKYTFGLTLLAGAAFAAAGAMSPAHSQPPPDQISPWPYSGTKRPKAPEYLPGEAVLRLAPGADAASLAQFVGLHLQQQLQYAPHTYVFTGIQGDVKAACATLNRIPGVLRAEPNLVYHAATLPAAQPNDPLVSQQWALQMLHAQDLWSITVGERLVAGPQRNVLVGVIDSGFEVAHPDLAENMAPGAFDFVRNAAYDESQIPNSEFTTHGSNVAGAIAGVTNNSTGIASLPWEGVKILACHAGDNFNIPDSPQDEPIVTSSAVVNAMYYCIDQQTDIINLSFGVQGTTASTPGSSATTDPLVAQAVQDAYQNGIVLVGSSGNYRQLTSGGSTQQSPPVQFPANQPEVIAVGAVGANGELAYYSNGGPELQFMAPGGNSATFSGFDPASLVLTTDSLNSIFSSAEGLPAGYVYAQGTSIAAGYVSGAIATLITQGARDETLSPTERVERIRTLLRKTARNQFGGRSNDFGYGIIDPAAALREFTPVIDLISPNASDETNSFGESLNAFITRPILTPVPGGAPGDYVRTLSSLTGSDFQVSKNGEDITDLVQFDAASGNILFTPDEESRYNVGMNDLEVVATDATIPGLARSLTGPADGNIPNRLFRFRVTPRVEQAGLQLLSIPYQLQHNSADEEHSPDNVSFLFGGNLVRLARWLPNENRYAIFDINGSPQDPEAMLTTTSAGVAHPPVGLGFFARVTQQTQVQLLGNQETSAFYEIPLQPGFNLIGDPYPFPVPWNTVSVRYGNEVISVAEAYSRKLMSNVLWSYQGGRYTLQILPNGALQPWQAHWVRSSTTLSLLVPRINAQVGSGQSASSRIAAPKHMGWEMPLTATANKKEIGSVTVGMARNANDGQDGRDLELPPAIERGSEFRIRHNWRQTSGRFAQDIRSAVSRLQRWDLEVETSKPGELVSLTWDSLPAAAHASIQVEGASRPQLMNATGQVSFKAARAGVHHVTLLAAARPGA